MGQVQHQASDCPLRLISCRFYGDMVQAGSSAMDVRDRLRGLSEHESICGSRTAPCGSCGRSVMLKDMNIHQTAVQQKNKCQPNFPIPVKSKISTILQGLYCLKFKEKKKTTAVDICA